MDTMSDEHRITDVTALERLYGKPSGAAVAVIWPAITPAALARLSTTICWPNTSESLAPKRRARMSVVPPCAAGVINLIGRLG